MPGSVRRMGSRRSAALGVVIVLGLAACSGGGSGDDTAGPTDSGSSGACDPAALTQAEKPVAITMWHTMSNNNGRVFEAIVNDFNTAQDDVRVKLVDQSAEISAVPKFKAGLTTGDLPDVLQLEETALQTMIDSGATVPVQECVDADDYSLADYLPKVTGYYTVQDELRSMPYNPSSPILFYDKSKFAAAGLDPERPPQTLEEVREYSEQIVARGAAKHGIALRVAEFFTEFWSSKNGQVYANHGNGRLERATKVDLDNSTQRTVWTWWDDMVDDGLMLNTGVDLGGITHLLAVGTGDAAMTIESSGALGPIVNVLEGGQYPGVTIGTGPLPGVKARRRRADRRRIALPPEAVESGGARRGVELDQVPRLARAADPPAPRDRVRADPQVGGGVPRGAGAVAEDPAYRTAYDQLLNGPTTLATTGPVIGDFGSVRDAVVDGITSMLTTSRSPLDALRETEQKANTALDAYNERVVG